MSDKPQLPVLRLDLEAGILRIKTGNFVYEISVKGEASQTRIVRELVESDIIAGKPIPLQTISPPAAEQDAPVAPVQPIVLEDTFYREISEEMLQEIGRLARQLSLSIKTPVDLGAVKGVDLRKAGIDLESAKAQLQDIVAMTEKATLTIMDISEGIQESCNTIRKNLDEITGLSFVNKLDLKADAGAGTGRSLLDIINGVMSRQNRVKEMLGDIAADTAAGEKVRGNLAAAVGLLDENTGILGSHMDRFSNSIYGTGEDYSIIRRDDHDKLVKAVTSTDNVIQHIIANLSRILESLSFQDLSGQRIMRILSMLSNVQVQLLSILVSYRVRLMKKREERGLSPQEGHEIANKEVDRIRNLITSEAGGADWGERLDQDAVDKLLEDLGF